MAKLTQRDRILQYLQDFGSITSYEAYTELGITHQYEISENARFPVRRRFRRAGQDVYKILPASW